MVRAVAALLPVLAAAVHPNDAVRDEILSLDARGQPPNEHLLLRPWRLADGRRSLSVDDVAVSVNATAVEDGDVVRVSVSNPGARSATDWVALYSPADANLSEVVPVKFALVGERDGYAATGEAQLDFEVVSMRADMRFVFFASDWQCNHASQWGCSDWSYFGGADAVAAGSSDALALARPEAPTHPRVVPVDNGDALAVVWTGGPLAWGGFTSGKYAALRWAVGDALDAGALDNLVVAETATYAADELCGPPASTWGWRDPGPIHTARIVGAARGARVSYVLLTLPDGPASDVFTTTVPPAVGPDASLRLAAFGDLGRGSFDDASSWLEYGAPAKHTAAALAADAAAGALDAIYHIGDLSYAVGMSAVWDLYAHMMAPATSRVPYFVNVGNHEYDAPTAAFSRLGRVRSHYNGSDSGGECGVPTHRQYLAPLAPLDAPWYSLELGPAHVVAMSTEHDFRRGSAQHAWLAADLGAVDKTVTPWILFSGHRPGYIDSDWSSTRHNGGGDIEVMALWIEHVEPLLLAAGVQLVFWGHNHQVQRLCAVARGECVQRSAGAEHAHVDPPAPVHMVIGTGGASFTNNSVRLPGERLTFDERHFLQHGYARIAIDGATTLRWEWYDAVHDEVIDTMTITQADPRGGGGGGGTRSPLRGGRLVALALLAGVGLVVAAVVARRRGRGSDLYRSGQRPDDQEEEMITIPKSDEPPAIAPKATDVSAAETVPTDEC